MEFYEIDILNENSYTSRGINISYFTKILKDIPNITTLKSMEDLSPYSIVILNEGTFSGIALHGQIKDGRKKLSYALIENGKQFNIEDKDVKYQAQIFNGALLVGKDMTVLIEKEKSKFKGLSEEENKALNWLESGNTGISSLSMCGAIYPNLKSLHSKLENLRYDAPYDSSDFKRCIGFLNAVPEARNKLNEVRAISSSWNKLIDNWASLEEKSADAESIREILDACKASKLKHN